MAERWRRAHESACAFGSDRAAVAQVHGESGAILEALGLAAEGAAPDDLSDFSHREVIGLVVVRARQMAALGMTPGAASAYVPTLAAALGQDFGAPFAGLLAVAMEAYNLTRDEHLLAEGQRILAEHTPVVRLGQGVVACFLTGNPEPERLTRVLERLEQEAFRSSATAMLVDLAHLQPEPEALVAALAADEGARMLGVRCIFTGVDARLTPALERAGVALDQVETAPTFEEGLSRLVRRGLLAQLLGR